ncbi:hypothetical protein M0811_13561 [Anaeramoeba ignava]|uniref:Uncharacterized protein n=1 Tax=Anaeramoeba ignava TaxID=1746090 RepID=A0A9Q0L661_ANAIG|nr:hypothetical protein M0811_13561 [Anaeramoeba ignava]
MEKIRKSETKSNQMEKEANIQQQMEKAGKQISSSTGRRQTIGKIISEYNSNIYQFFVSIKNNHIPKQINSPPNPNFASIL